jgi:glycosyltransferase involved in cell wall biosynthesis/nucleotide-binding universal stress UspA family protein
MKKSRFASVQTALVPVVYGQAEPAALAAALALALRVHLLGIVRLTADQSLSAGADAARRVRAHLRTHATQYGERVRIESPVLVSHHPWQDLQAFVAARQPDLLILEWPSHLNGLGIAAEDVLAASSGDVVLARGPFPPKVQRVLVPMRGGPHAELALRLGLNLHARDVCALHLQTAGDAGSDAPFHGLARVLARLPEVQTEVLATSDAAHSIIERAGAYDVVVMGATTRAVASPVSLGVVADQVVRASPSAVLAVKTRRPMPETALDENVGTQAISILVDKWFAENSFHADEFADLCQMVEIKRRQGLTISLAMPALNEAETVGKVIRTVKRALMDRVPLLDEIVLMDSSSTDRTRTIAHRLGVPVYVHQELLPELGVRRGKGEALWKSLLVTRGDIVVWIDTDIVNIHPRFVYGVIGPMLLNPQIQFVKGFYRRPLKVGEKVQAGGGGRVTELTARPLLNLFYPELSGVVQPLSGEYGGRRTALEQCPFFSGYGVEIGLLIEIFERFGQQAIAQVDLLERIHHNQSLEALSKMSFAVIQAVLRKLERRYDRALLEEVNKSMKLIRHGAHGYFLDVEEIAERERPPMIDVATYRARHPAGSTRPR